MTGAIVTGAVATGLAGGPMVRGPMVGGPIIGGPMVGEGVSGLYSGGFGTVAVVKGIGRGVVVNPPSPSPASSGSSWVKTESGTEKQMTWLPLLAETASGAAIEGIV